jgi:dissimilatory sulfite reductase (desulfoviridin) alpha/beta subunit
VHRITAQRAAVSHLHKFRDILKVLRHFPSGAVHLLDRNAATILFLSHENVLDAVLSN